MLFKKKVQRFECPQNYKDILLDEMCILKMLNIIDGPLEFIRMAHIYFLFFKGFSFFPSILTTCLKSISCLQ